MEEEIIDTTSKNETNEIRPEDIVVSVIAPAETVNDTSKELPPQVESKEQMEEEDTKRQEEKKIPKKSQPPAKKPRAPKAPKPVKERPRKTAVKRTFQDATEQNSDAIQQVFGDEDDGVQPAIKRQKTDAVNPTGTAPPTQQQQRLGKAADILVENVEHQRKTNMLGALKTFSKLINHSHWKGIKGARF